MQRDKLISISLSVYLGSELPYHLFSFFFTRPPPWGSTKIMFNLLSTCRVTFVESMWWIICDLSFVVWMPFFTRAKSRQLRISPMSGSLYKYTFICTDSCRNFKNKFMTSYPLKVTRSYFYYWGTSGTEDNHPLYVSNY